MSSKKKVFMFFSVVALFNMAASFAHPITPLLFKHLNLQDYMFGVALACMMLTNFLFSPFWGKLADYISSRNTLLVSCVGYAMGQVLFGLAKTTLTMILVRAFSGIFAGGIFVAILTYIVNTSPDENTRSKYLVLSATIQAVCNSLGFFIGGMLGDIGIYVTIAAQVVTLIVCGVLFRIVCVEDAKMSVNQAQPKILFKEANPFKAFMEGRNFMTLTLMVLFGMCALQNLSQTAFDQSFNYYVIDVMNLSSGYNGTIKAVMSIVTLIGNSTICVWLMNHTNLRKSIIYVLLLSTASITAVIFIPSGNLVPFIIMNIIFFALSSISIPIMQSLVSSAKTTGDSNLVMGFYNGLKSFGGIFGAIIAGFTYMVNTKAPFITCAIGFALATLCAIIYKARTGKNSQN